MTYDNRSMRAAKGIAGRDGMEWLSSPATFDCQYLA